MSTKLSGSRGEYLWEYDYAQNQVLALAEAFPAERYGWRPVETARSVSEVLVHVGASGRAFLVVLGVKVEPDLYGKLEGEGVARTMAMVAKNESLEKSMTDKADVLALLKTSLSAVRTAYAEASDADLERPEMFGMETSTLRRLYMRTLCHLHEHMGQLIAYSRAMGLPAPWRAQHDAWRKAIEEQLAASKK